MEPFHRDGKQHLGMGDCQLRDSQGQTRHLHLVLVAYSVVMRNLRNPEARNWAGEWLTTIGQGCRAVAKECLRETLRFAVELVQAYGWK
jgi:hypothetical protein